MEIFISGDKENIFQLDSNRIRITFMQTKVVTGMHRTTKWLAS